MILKTKEVKLNSMNHYKKRKKNQTKYYNKQMKCYKKHKML